MTGSVMEMGRVDLQGRYAGLCREHRRLLGEIRLADGRGDGEEVMRLVGEVTVVLAERLPIARALGIEPGLRRLNRRLR